MKRPNNLFGSFGSDELEKLQQDYIDSIPNKLKTLEDLIHQLQLEMNLGRLQELTLNVHKLAGSAGVYGFPEVSKICKQFNQELLQKTELFKTSGGQESWATDFEDYMVKIRKSFLSGDPQNGQK